MLNPKTLHNLKIKYGKTKHKNKCPIWIFKLRQLDRCLNLTFNTTVIWRTDEPSQTHKPDLESAIIMFWLVFR